MGTREYTIITVEDSSSHIEVNRMFIGLIPSLKTDPLELRHLGNITELATFEIIMDALKRVSNGEKVEIIPTGEVQGDLILQHISEGKEVSIIMADQKIFGGKTTDVIIDFMETTAGKERPFIVTTSAMAELSADELHVEAGDHFIPKGSKLGVFGEVFKTGAMYIDNRDNNREHYQEFINDDGPEGISFH